MVSFLVNCPFELLKLLQVLKLLAQELLRMERGAIQKTIHLMQEYDVIQRKIAQAQENAAESMF